MGSSRREASAGRVTCCLWAPRLPFDTLGCWVRTPPMTSPWPAGFLRGSANWGPGGRWGGRCWRRGYLYVAPVTFIPGTGPWSRGPQLILAASFFGQNQPVAPHRGTSSRWRGPCLEDRRPQAHGLLSQLLGPEDSRLSPCRSCPWVTRMTPLGLPSAPEPTPPLNPRALCCWLDPV